MPFRRGDIWQSLELVRREERKGKDCQRAVCVYLGKCTVLLEALCVLFNGQRCTGVIASRLERCLEGESSEHLVESFLSSGLTVALNSSC